jgi:hypothetical protein
MDSSNDQSNSTQGNTASVEGVLAGLLTREQLAEQLNCSERTIIRYERAGMPFIAFGMLRRYHPPSVREWVLSKERGHAVPKRGRPAGRKAA